MLRHIDTIRIFDGAMGTQLVREPRAAGHIFEELNVLEPALIQQVHRRYLEAGADYLTTNSFSLSPAKWTDSSLTWRQVADAAIDNARKAAEGTAAHIMFDIGPSGKMMEPMGDFTFEAAYRNVQEVVAHTRDKVKGYILETFSDLHEIRAAILAVKENCDLPVYATMTFDPSGRTLTGSTPEIVAYTLTALGVDVLGINCSTSPERFVELVKRMRPFTHLPILTQPNMGIPAMRHGVTYYNYTDSEFAFWTKQLIQAGAAIVGGCCGTSPTTIQAIAQYKGMPVASYPQPDGTYICSATRMLRLGKAVICGERLNPTGKKALQQALRAGDFEYLQKEALNQEACGADFLDLNVGIPQCDEQALLCRATRKVQEICDLPLQIDSSNAQAMEAAIRVYNGVPMINSINGDAESLDALLPVMAKYGTPAVSLPLDKQGIPETAEGRMEIAQRILQRGAHVGIPKKQFVFDALVMTISSNPDHGRITLETLQRFKEQGSLTIVGLSNVSFGLPQRAYLNRTFLAMALERGLDMPIMNPMDRDTVQTVKAFKALSGLDVGCEQYIAFNAAEQQALRSDDLFHAITLGLKDAVAGHLQKELVDKTPEAVINEILIPALAQVGDRFDKKILFLPQLIQSAEAAKTAFDLLAAQYTRSETQQKGSVVIATVKGDIHDIGKNIVKVVMESHGYKVVDLGKNVDQEAVAAAYLQYNPMAIGLSALMTTTVDSMAHTIKYLRQQGITIPVLVGGAVLVDEIARQIGADYYAKDALSAVSILEQIQQ